MFKTIASTIASTTPSTGAMGSTPPDGMTAAKSASVAPKGYDSEDKLVLASKVDKASAPKLAPEEVRFQNFASDQRLDPAGVKELTGFAKEQGVPLSELQQVGANKAYDTPQKKLMAMKSYAVAKDAVDNKKLGPADRKVFSERVLPNLRDGNIKMDPKTQKNGAAASYRPGDNHYSDDKIDLRSPGDRSFTVHELRHAAQDAQGEGKPYTQTRGQSEKQAYSTQCEYELREAGVLTEVDGGTRIDNGKLKKFEQRKGANTTFDRAVVYERAAENLEQGKPELNGDLQVRVENHGDVPATELGTGKDGADVLRGFATEEQQKAENKIARNTRAQGGGFITDVLPRDGFNRVAIRP